MTQEKIAKLLDIEQDTYKQYETRTPLPHRHVEKFCIATGITADWLFATSNNSDKPARKQRVHRKKVTTSQNLGATQRA